MDNIRLLYVEDDPTDRELTRRHLHQYAPEMEVWTVCTGREAREIVASKQFDVVLLDYCLPDVEGLKLLQELLTAAANLPVVMVTGGGDQEVAVAALRTGAMDYVTKKPGYLDRLPTVIRETLGRFRSERTRRARRLRVLYAEHEFADIDLTLRYLAAHVVYLNVETVATGSATLRKLEAGKYDLLLLDYRMPDMNGLEILQELRERGIHLPVVMITGHGDEEIAVQALKLGALDYIVKREGYLTQLPSTIESAIARCALVEEKETLLRVEESLRGSEERFRSVVQSAPDAIILANDSGQIISWNTGAQAIFGYAAEEVMGGPITILMPERHRDAHEAGFKRFRSTGESRVIGRVVESEGLRKDGSECPLEYSLASWHAGEERFFSAILRDITERKQFQMHLEATVKERTRELQEVNRDLEVASRHKSEFLAHMSHELRTPLNSILGFSELIEAGIPGPLTEKQTRFLRHIHDSGTHLLQLINDLLDISKVEAGKLELRPEVFPLAEALTSAIEQFRTQADAKGVTLALQVEQAPGSLVADPLRFKQILYNLLSNAVKFTPKGGSITVTARPSVRPDCVEIAVTDTGIGIKAEDLSRLFQEFTQLDSSLAKSHQGTGLGLALTKRLVELHGGTITATSPGEGQGSTFTVTLPVRPPNPHLNPPPQRERRSHRVSLPPMRGKDRMGG